jgi:hypothetical protein
MKFMAIVEHMFDTSAGEIRIGDYAIKRPEEQAATQDPDYSKAAWMMWLMASTRPKKKTS